MIETTLNYTSYYLTDADQLPLKLSIPYFFADDHIKVYELDEFENGMALSNGMHYYLEGAGDEDGGELILKVRGRTGNTVLVIMNDPEVRQLTDYIRNGKFDSQAHEDELDKGTMIDQSIQGQLNRALRAPAYERMEMEKIPYNSRKLKVLGFDGLGQPYFPFSVEDVLNAIYSNLPGEVTVSPAPSILTVVASPDDMAVTITWELAGVPDWIIFQIHPTDTPSASSVVWVEGAKGTLVLKGEYGPGDYNIYAWGRNDPGLNSARIQVGGGPVTLGIPFPEGLAVDVAAAHTLVLTKTAAANMWTWVQLQLVGSTNYKTEWLHPNATELTFNDLAPGFYRIAVAHQHDVSKKTSPVIYLDNDANTGTGPGFEVTGAEVTLPVLVSATSDGKRIRIEKAADADDWTYIQAWRTGTNEVYSSDWMPPGDTIWEFNVTTPGDYQGRMWHQNSITRETSAEVTFVLGSPVVFADVPAPTGAVISVPEAGKLKVDVVPEAGIWHYIQMWKQGGDNSDLQETWINENNNGYIFEWLTGGFYGVRIVANKDGRNSEWVVYDNSGAFYQVEAAPQPGDLATSPNDPTISQVNPGTGTLEVIMADNTGSWTFVQAFIQGNDSAVKEGWIEPGTNTFLFTQLEAGSYAVAAWRRNAETGAYSTVRAYDDNAGNFYTLAAGVPFPPDIEGKVIAGENRLRVSRSIGIEEYHMYLEIIEMNTEEKREKWVTPGSRWHTFLNVTPGRWTVYGYHIRAGLWSEAAIDDGPGSPGTGFEVTGVPPTNVDPGDGTDPGSGNPTPTPPIVEDWQIRDDEVEIILSATTNKVPTVILRDSDGNLVQEKTGGTGETKIKFTKVPAGSGYYINLKNTNPGTGVASETGVWTNNGNYIMVPGAAVPTDISVVSAIPFKNTLIVTVTGTVGFIPTVNLRDKNGTLVESQTGEVGETVFTFTDVQDDTGYYLRVRNMNPTTGVLGNFQNWTNGGNYIDIVGVPSPTVVSAVPSVNSIVVTLAGTTGLIPIVALWDTNGQLVIKLTGEIGDTEITFTDVPSKDGYYLRVASTDPTTGVVSNIENWTNGGSYIDVVGSALAPNEEIQIVGSTLQSGVVLTTDFATGPKITVFDTVSFSSSLVSSSVDFSELVLERAVNLDIHWQVEGKITAGSLPSGVRLYLKINGNVLSTYATLGSTLQSNPTLNTPMVFSTGARIPRAEFLAHAASGPYSITVHAVASNACTMEFAGGVFQGMVV